MHGGIMPSVFIMLACAIRFAFSGTLPKAIAWLRGEARIFCGASRLIAA